MLQANIKQGIFFSGAILSLGTAKAIADVDPENQGRFTSSIGNITGLLHMHDSGTGVSPSLGNVALFPWLGYPTDDIINCRFT